MRWLLQPAAPVAALVLAVVLLIAVSLLDPTPRVDHPAVVHSARLAVIFWGLATALLLLGVPARQEWLCAWLMFVVHVAASFHFAHDWSHAAAFRHTAAAAGVGEGLFVNYIFTLLWGADAIWLAASPDTYAHRPWWVGWVVHGFLAFIVFNATIVFGTATSRVLGVLVFAGLGIAVFRARPRSARVSS